MTPLVVPSILITDDDSTFRETLRGVFEPIGFHTILAADGEEAVKIVSTQEIHLVLLDMHMPRLSGLETLRRVKQLRSTIPCIIISAGLDDRLRKEAQQDQAFSVLSKPIDRGTITRTVCSALHRAYGWKR
jgi:CheY-like chemotaxis protein